jgi:hypothetical protein
MKTKTLILGNGEVGTALFEVLSNVYETYIWGKNKTKEHFDIIHICFPYNDQFLAEVKRYQSLYSPRYTVIHSTVPVGTSRKVGAIHSPIRGVHPHLAKSLQTFVKFVGGEGVDEVADYFRRAGIRVHLCRKPETTELLKLNSTETYLREIRAVQKLEKICQKYEVPFSEVYTLATTTYNEGYERLGLSEYHRPILQPLQKEIGGHCLLSNHRIIKKFNIANYDN